MLITNQNEFQLLSFGAIYLKEVREEQLILEEHLVHSVVRIQKPYFRLIHEKSLQIEVHVH